MNEGGTPEVMATGGNQGERSGNRRADLPDDLNHPYAYVPSTTLQYEYHRRPRHFLRDVPVPKCYLFYTHQFIPRLDFRIFLPGCLP